jgi:hypothetical protein
MLAQIDLEMITRIMCNFACLAMWCLVSLPGKSIMDRTGNVT